MDTGVPAKAGIMHQVYGVQGEGRGEAWGAQEQHRNGSTIHTWITITIQINRSTSHLWSAIHPHNNGSTIHPTSMACLGLLKRTVSGTTTAKT